MKLRAHLFLIWLAAFVGMSGASLLAAAGVAGAFDQANKLYEEGKYADAAGAYEKLVQSGSVSPAIYFNLGNALFKAGQIGRAIAAYRQAERLTPRDPDVRANLQFARNQVQGPTWRAGRWQRWLGTLNLNEWTLLAAGAAWFWLLLLAAIQLRPAWKQTLRGWVIASGVGAAVLAVCLGAALYAGGARQTVIVTAPEVAVREGPLEESKSTFTAHDGAELMVLDQKDDWLQVTDGARRIGWLKANTVLRFYFL